MSDTPRTDSEAIGFARVLINQGMSDRPGEWMIELIHSDFARTLERELAAANEARDALRGVLLRNGFVQCDIAACNCGSWHHRHGLPERFEEIRQALSDAGHPVCNENGNLPSRALQALIQERDDARENARVRSGEALDYYSAMLNLAHEFGAKDGDNMIEVIGNGIDALRAEVERLRALMARILDEPSNTMSDAKALREIIRMVKAQTAIDAERKERTK